MSVANQMMLGEVVRFGNGKAIKPGGTGLYPVYGSNGIIGESNEFRHENGVVIGRVGAYCGAVLYCPTRFWASDNTLVAYPASEQVDTKFLYYLLADAKLSRYAGGAAQPLVTQTVLKQVEVRIPPLPIQQRIAGILSAYDELIENSQRRIKILESMARALYREWFVHFRFPGHEIHPRVASPLGEIPQGWEAKNLGGLTKLITKGTTPTTLGREFQQDGINFVKAESIEPSGILIESKFAKIDADTHVLLQRSQLCSGDILFSIAGVIGRVCSVPSRILPANTNQALAIVRCASALHVPFLYMTLRDDNFKNHCLGHVVQTAQANISLSVLKAVPIVCPPRELLTKFNAHAESLLRQIQVLSEKIQNLRRTRNLLLPRLLSGQIDLEAAEPDQALATA